MSSSSNQSASSPSAGAGASAAKSSDAAATAATVHTDPKQAPSAPRIDKSEILNALHLSIAAYDRDPKAKLKDLQRGVAKAETDAGAFVGIRRSLLREENGVYLIAKSADTIYCAVRGSKITSDWCRNFSALPVSAGGVNEHYGFYQRAKMLPFGLLREHLFSSKTTRVVITGHSLGSAVAQAATYELLSGLGAGNVARVQCIGFSSPLVFSGPTVADINSRYGNCFVHFVDDRDIVVKIVAWGQQLLKKHVLDGKTKSKPRVMDEGIATFMSLLTTGVASIMSAPSLGGLTAAGAKSVAGKALTYAFDQVRRAIDFHPVGVYYNVHKNGNVLAQAMTRDEVKTLLDYNEGDLQQVAIADILNLHDIGRHLADLVRPSLTFTSCAGCALEPPPLPLLTAHPTEISCGCPDSNNELSIEIRGERMWNVLGVTIAGLGEFFDGLDREIPAEELSHVDADRIAFTVRTHDEQPGRSLPSDVKVSLRPLFMDGAQVHLVPRNSLEATSGLIHENTISLLYCIFTLLLLAEDRQTKRALASAKRFAAQIICRVPLMYFLGESGPLLLDDKETGSSASAEMIEWLATVKHNSPGLLSPSYKAYLTRAEEAAEPGMLEKVFGSAETQTTWSRVQKCTTNGIELKAPPFAVPDTSAQNLHPSLQTPPLPDTLACIKVPSLQTWFNTATPEETIDKLCEKLFAGACDLRSSLKKEAVDDKRRAGTAELANALLVAMLNVRTLVTLPVCRFLSPGNVKDDGKIHFPTGLIGKQAEGLFDSQSARTVVKAIIEGASVGGGVIGAVLGWTTLWGAIDGVASEVAAYFFVGAATGAATVPINYTSSAAALGGAFLGALDEQFKGRNMPIGAVEADLARVLSTKNIDMEDLDNGHRGVSKLLESMWSYYRQGRPMLASRIQILLLSHHLRQELVKFPLVAFHGITSAGKTTMLEYAVPDRAKGGSSFAARTAFPSVTWVLKAAERGIAHDLCVLDTIGSHTVLAMGDEKEAFEEVIRGLNDHLLAISRSEVRFAGVSAAKTTDSATFTRLPVVLEATSASTPNRPLLAHPTMTLMTHADLLDSNVPWQVDGFVDVLETGDEEQIVQFYVDKFASVQRRLNENAGKNLFDTSLSSVAPRRWAVLAPLAPAKDTRRIKVSDLTWADLRDDHPDHEETRNDLRSATGEVMRNHYFYKVQEMLRQPRRDLIWTGVVQPRDVFEWICAGHVKRKMEE